MAQKQTNPRKRVLLVALAVLVLAVGVGAVWYAMKGLKQTHAVVSPSPSTGEQSTADTKVHAGPAHDTSSPSATPVPAGAGSSAPVLKKPFGPTDNVRSISLSGQTTMMDSTCGSVTGAKCYIRATMGSRVLAVSATKTIPSDTEGVDLPWDAKQLSVGIWNIQAIATLNGQQAVSDPETLTVTN